MRKFGGFARIASYLMLFSLLLIACSGATTNNPTPTAGTTGPLRLVKVALVTNTGGLDDTGFIHLAALGYQKAEMEYHFPDKVFQTQAATASVFEQNLTMAAQSADLVIVVGFQMGVSLDKIALQFPNTRFAMVDGCPTQTDGGPCASLANVSSLLFNEQEAGCLAGAMAGQMELDSKATIAKLLGKNTIGAVGGMNIPSVNHYLAGYKYCALKVDTKLKVLISYSNDFTNSAPCNMAAVDQLSKQADIIFQVAGDCGTGVFDATTQAKVFGIGFDSAQSTSYTNVVSNVIKKADTAVFTIIDDTEKGQFSTKLPAFDLTNDGIEYTTVLSTLPADVDAMAKSYSDMITSGQLTPLDKIP